MKALVHYFKNLFRRGREHRPVDTAPQHGVDLQAYMGRWYEQARYDHAFEDGLERVFTDYTMNSNGRVSISNNGEDAGGRPYHAEGMGSCPHGDGRLRVSFVPPYSWFTAPYHILYATPGYTGAVVSGEDDTYLWLLTREQHPAPELLQELEQQAARRGFDLARLHYTRQGTV